MFERTKNLRLSIIKQIELEASKYPDVISLAQGVPSFDTPGCIKRRVEQALKRGVVAKYSLVPGLPELREMIEVSLAKDYMYYDWQNEIIVTAGSIEGITATIMAITTPGDEVIIPEPTYTSYREVIYLAGCQPVYVPLNESKGWSFTTEKFEQAITDKTKAIFYCNPNNPTGTIINKSELLKLAELAKKHNLYLITDDVYKDFVFDDQKIFSLAEVPELRKRVIRLFSFSKVYAMTGWRVAYLHTDASLAKEILKVHDSLVTCAPVISQYGALGALEMAEKDVEKFNIEYKKRRDLVCKRLNKLKQHLSYTKPEGAYYVFPRLRSASQSFGGQAHHSSSNLHLSRLGEGAGGRGKGEVDSWKFALDLLKKVQVAVVPGVAFGPNGEGHIRINFGRSENDINVAMDRMEEYFKGILSS